MCDTMALKTQFLSSLSRFVASSPEIGAVHVLRDVFVLSSRCRPLSQEPKSLLTSDEQRQLKHHLLAAIPAFDLSLMKTFGCLGKASASVFRGIRSGLQFLRDDFVVGDQELEDRYNELMDGDGVKRIEIKLDEWSGDRADGDFGDFSPIDLRGVPYSHDWWSEAERRDSSVKHGPPPQFMNEGKPPTP